MKLFHKPTPVAVAMIVALSLSSCSSGDAKTAEGPDKIEKIGLMVQDMSNPFFSAMDKGGKEAAGKIGASLNTQDAQLDLANQNNQIDAFIQQGVDLIVISAVDQDGIEPAIKRAKAGRDHRHRRGHARQGCRRGDHDRRRPGWGEVVYLLVRADGREGRGTPGRRHADPDHH